MNDVDKSIIKTLKITETVKDSLIKTYNNYWGFCWIYCLICTISSFVRLK
jgi:hypothetical protein